MRLARCPRPLARMRALESKEFEPDASSGHYQSRPCSALVMAERMRLARFARLTSACWPRGRTGECFNTITQPSLPEPPVGGFGRLAERMRFELTIRFPVYTLSRRAPSTTRPPLQHEPLEAPGTLARSSATGPSGSPLSCQRSARVSPKRGKRQDRTCHKSPGIAFAIATKRSR